MDLADVTFLRLDLEQLQHILFELTIREDEIEFHGLGRVLDKVPVSDTLFDNISAKLVRLLRSSESIDFRMSEELKQLITETKIQDAITEISIMLRVARHKRPRRGLFYPIFYPINLALFGRKPSQSDQPVAKALAGVSRLLPMLNAIEAIESNRKADDDAVLKPSGIDERVVVSKIDAAIHAVDVADNISPAHRVTLIRYLQNSEGGS